MSVEVQGTPRKRGSIRREEILDSAVTLFRTSGYHNATMADIARETGLAGSSLYRHFPSKEAILVEALLRAGRHFLPHLEVASDREHGDPWTALDELVERLATAVALEPNLSTVLLRDRTSLPLTAQETIAGTIDHLAGIWAAQLRAAAPVDADAADVIVRGAMALVLSLAEGERGSVDRTAIVVSMARASMRAGVLDSVSRSTPGDPTSVT